MHFRACAWLAMRESEDVDGLRPAQVMRRVTTWSSPKTAAGLIEILAPNGSDKALYKWVRARHERDGLDFLEVENAEVRAPAMKSEQRVMIGTEALGKWLTTAGLVEHAADTDAVDMRRFNTESDDTAREDIHHDHYPEALQQDRLAAKQD